MPPGVSGLTDNGSGASRVHSTNPSGRGAPEATPRLNGLPACQLCAAAIRMTAGAATSGQAGTCHPADEAAAAEASRKELRLHDRVSDFDADLSADLAADLDTMIQYIRAIL